MAAAQRTGRSLLAIVTRVVCLRRGEVVGAAPTAGESLAYTSRAAQRPLMLRAHCLRTTFAGVRNLGAVGCAALRPPQKGKNYTALSVAVPMHFPARTR